MEKEELKQGETVEETSVKEEKAKKKPSKKEELEKAIAEAEESTRKWYAVTAEYENYRRRTQNQAAARYQDGRNDVVASLFPIGDNLERAMSSCADENTKQGLDMVLKAFKKVLEGEGVEEIDPIGQPFNADTMEAIMAMPCADGEEAGVVKQVYVKGYKKGEKVLRYAQVIVTQ
ncbi:MAG: nucleotide exchange factor GrpE [Clostridia bacterium]|nr:nucleotide exchange factor GrpE [Clostridia bacterium]